MSHKGVNQLLCAALVDKKFCQTLLEDPAQTSQAGFHGSYFDLTEMETEMLSAIKSNAIEDFAMQVHHSLKLQEKQTESIEVFHQQTNYLPGYSLMPDRYADLPSPGQSR